MAAFPVAGGGWALGFVTESTGPEPGRHPGWDVCLSQGPHSNSHKLTLWAISCLFGCLIVFELRETADEAA